MPLATLLLAGLYLLPDVRQLPAPTGSQQARIQNALAELRRGGSEEGDRALRDLALVGEAALPAIVKRLNAADAAERLLLIAAVSRMRRAAPLLEQARKDPHPAVRAWVGVPARGTKPGLRRLAARYLDLLALAEPKLRYDVAEDLTQLEPALGRPLTTFKALQKRMRDRRLADAIQVERSSVARRFALAGEAALRGGGLAPDLSDPLFVAYVALLREEDWAFLYALRALTRLGERLVPVLEPLLTRQNHDPHKILHILTAVRADGGRAYRERFASLTPDAQRALVRLTPHDVAFLERAALAAEGSVRSVALDSLLALDAPAGLAPARQLLDPKKYERGDFRRAALLLARAGALEPLVLWAAVSTPDGSELTEAMRALRASCRTALSDVRGKKAEALGAKLLESESRELRLLGLDLVRDFERLQEHDRDSAASGRRLVRLFGERGIRVVLGRGVDRPGWLLSAAKRAGSVAILMEFAQHADRDLCRDALRHLASLSTIPREHEAVLLAIHDRFPEELAALLPLGTDAVRQRFLAAGADALPILASRAQQSLPIPFAVPLLRFVKGADGRQLALIRAAAQGMPSVEPGLFAALLLAWDKVRPEDPGEQSIDEGPARQKQDLLETLARTEDAASAESLFARLLDGRLGDDTLALQVLKAAARRLPAERLAALVPLLKRQVRGEYPMAGKLAPPYAMLRRHILAGGINALAYTQVEAAVEPLCEFVLDPSLQAAAFDWKQPYGSYVPWVALEGLRHFRAAQVHVAFRKALRAAEESGRLAAVHPRHLYGILRQCREGRMRGRKLHEVALALCEVLERLPVEGEIGREKMMALGGLRRYADAARVARREAARKRERGVRDQDSFFSPSYFEGRALLYDALAAGDVAMFRAALPRIADRPYLLHLATWYLLFSVPDLALAEQAEELAVRRTGGLQHDYRDGLAAVRNRQKRHREALFLLDPDETLPVKRSASSGWFLYFQAKARLGLGDERGARADLENALKQDRRVLPFALRDEAFKGWTDVFAVVEEDFFDSLFR